MMKKVAPADRETTSMQMLRRSLASDIIAFVGDADEAATAIPRLMLYRHVEPTRPAAVRYEPSVAVVIQGQKRVELGSNTFLYDETQFLLTSLSLPVVSQVVHASPATPYLCMRLTFDMSMVREILAANDFPDVPLQVGHSAMTTGRASYEILSAFHRLMALTGTPQDAPYLSGLVEREIIYRLLQQPEGRRLRAIATAGDNSQRTAKAVTWITTNFAKPLRIEQLAEIAGMGVSTLHHNFRAHTSMSPLQFQKKLRLHAAKRRMLVDGMDAASAAFAVGYESASQFNREYSRLFGQSPIRDIRAARLDPRALHEPDDFTAAMQSDVT
jgi:AraC-like DNA-binding protein